MNKFLSLIFLIISPVTILVCIALTPFYYAFYDKECAKDLWKWYIGEIKNDWNLIGTMNN